MTTENRGHVSVDTVYRAYNAAVEANPLSRNANNYLDVLSHIATNRPANAVSNVQAPVFSYDSNVISDALRQARAGQLDSNVLSNTFFRFERANWRPDLATQRVYINARADHAPDVMRYVVWGIIDDPKFFPGVEMAKISGPGTVGGRSENIVIYTTGQEATDRVLGAIKTYQKAYPDHFMTTVPHMTHWELPGVATAAEPPARYAGRESFGSLRAKIIADTINEGRGHWLGPGEMLDLLSDNLRAAGINPDAPHLNLPEVQP